MGGPGVFRILVTGSRDFNAAAFLYETLDEVASGHEQILVIHGACTWPESHPRHGILRGADRWAQTHADRRGWQSYSIPADWETHGKRAGMIRNAQLVALGPDVCVGFPLPQSRGTFQCMKLARAAKIRVVDARRW